MKINHRVSVVNQLPKRKVYEPIVRAVKTALSQHKAPEGEVVVTLAESDQLLALNREYRNVDFTTDVLTFPGPDRFSDVLGDVIVNWDMAQTQAHRRGVRVIDEAAMLAVHGTLHLLGFDDHSDHDRNAMIAAMNNAMQASGLPTDDNWSSIPHEEPIYRA